MKKAWIALALWTGLAGSAFAEVAEIDVLTQKLLDRNELTLATREVRPYIFDSKVQNRLGAWLKNKSNFEYVLNCQSLLRPFLLSENILGPVCYFLRQDNKDKRAKYFPFIKRYMLETKTALAELAEDPRLTSAKQGEAKKYLKIYKQDLDAKVQKCFEPAMKFTYRAGAAANFAHFVSVRKCFFDTLPKHKPGFVFLSLNLAEEFSPHPGHAVSETGWIAGNQVEYLPWNEIDKSLVDQMQLKSGLVKKNYAFESKGTVQAFSKKIASDPFAVFKESEGFPPFEKHPIWMQEKGIFAEFTKAFAQAKESIFIDVFFFGGTMGAALAKHLIKLVEDKPELKVFILKDVVNNFDFKDEMMPVFNYLEAYSRLKPSRLVIVKSHITSHRSGLPHMLDSMISDKFIAASGLQKHLKLYAKAKSDHSKVVVIDGKSATPMAFVGSKNWTDGSGSICYDEVIKVTGPVAAVVLDDYYEDMFHALTREAAEDHLQSVASEGWAKDKYEEGQTKEEMAANILEPFDLLQRDASGKAHRKEGLNLAATGDVLVRTGMNNFDSTRTSAVDQDIQAILGAQEKIFIKDQFLFDRNVVMALLKAKERNDKLDIRIILEPLKDVTPAGLPNLLYLDVLKAVGIQIGWMKTYSGATTHQEYHMKTISVDGKYVIAGSANKDQTTMYGAFREQQLEVAYPEPYEKLSDRTAVAAHDAVFEDHWKNHLDGEFTEFNFEVPGGGKLKGLNGKPMTPEQFIGLLRNIVSVLFDAQEG